MAWWDAFWMVAAATAWIPLRRLARRHRHRLALVCGAAVCLVLIATTNGWSFTSPTADTLTPPLVIFVSMLGLAVLIPDAREGVRPFLYGALSLACLVVWGGLALYRAFDQGPPDVSARLSNGYRYESLVTGWAFTDSFVDTRVFHTARAFPFVEQEIATSRIRSPQRLVTNRDALGAEVVYQDGLRTVLVTYEGSVLDRVPF